MLPNIENGLQLRPLLLKIERRSDIWKLQGRNSSSNCLPTWSLRSITAATKSIAVHGLKHACIKPDFHTFRFEGKLNSQCPKKVRSPKKKQKRITTQNSLSSRRTPFFESHVVARAHKPMLKYEKCKDRVYRWGRYMRFWGARAAFSCGESHCRTMDPRHSILLQGIRFFSAERNGLLTMGISVCRLHVGEILSDADLFCASAEYAFVLQMNLRQIYLRL